MLAGYAGIFTLLVFTFWIESIMFFFILSIILSACTRTFFTIFIVHAGRLLTEEASALTGALVIVLTALRAEVFPCTTGFVAFI